jgi:hypothetical protein
MKLTSAPFRKWFNKESLGALGAIIALALVIAAVWGLAGCAGGQIYGSIQHRSSIPDTRDLNTSDTLGACGEVNLSKHGPYAPKVGLCFNWEMTNKPVYGQDPSAHAYFNFPLKVWE